MNLCANGRSEIGTGLNGIIRIISVLQIFSKVIAFNVALNKNGTYCDKGPLSEKLFDGDKTIVESMIEKCRWSSFMKVDLQSSYDIIYIVVYGGRENNRGQLDFFNVYRLTDKVMDWCSMYPGIFSAAKSDSGIRINCYPSSKMHSMVNIESNQNEGLHIAEVEVHTSGSTEIALHFLGCFSEPPKFEAPYVDLESCRKGCLFWRFVIFARKGDKCACFLELPFRNESQTMNCTFQCDIGIGYCGGEDSYSVFLMKPPLPHYVGCLPTTVDYKNKASESSKRPFDIAKCIRVCDLKGDSYALIQGRFCMCESTNLDFESLPYYLFLETQSIETCITRCINDTDFMCGGIQRSSVYRTCTFKSNELHAVVPCHIIFKCRDGLFNMYGECESGCEPGFFGDHCFEQDIDECEFRPCDSISSTCRNLNGSYACDCKPGYVEESDGACIAEDQMVWFFLIGFLLPSMILIAGYFVHKMMRKLKVVASGNVAAR